MRAVWQRRNQNNRAGASMVEVVLSLPIFIALVFFVIDAGRYFLMLGMMNYAAQQAVDFASKLEIETDTKIATSAGATSAATCKATPTDLTTDPCVIYLKRVKGIVDRASTIAMLVLSAPTSTNPTRLIGFNHYVGSDYPVSSPYYSALSARTAALNDLQNVGAAFLRPGERVRRNNAPADLHLSTIVEHATRGYLDTAVITDPDQQLAYGWPDASHLWADILETEPLEVRIDAIYQPLTPFFPRVSMQAVQYAFRRARSFRPGPPAAATPKPAKTSTPTNTPLATPTATVTATASATEVVQDTETPTVTATSTITPTKEPTSTGTATGTATQSPTVTETESPTVTSSATSSSTATPTGTASGTATVTPTVTTTPTMSITPTQTATASITPTSSVTPTLTATNTMSPTGTATQTATATRTATITATATTTATRTATRTRTPTKTPKSH